MKPIQTLAPQAPVAAHAAVSFPVLLRVPRLRPEATQPRIVLPPAEGPRTLGRALALMVLLCALAMVSRWQPWLAWNPGPEAPRPHVEPLPDLPPLRPALEPLRHGAPVVRPGPVHVRPMSAIPTARLSGTPLDARG